MKLTELIDYIDRIPSSTLLVGMIVCGAVIGWFLSNRKDIKELWDSWYKNKKRKDELLNMLLNDHERIGKYEDSRRHDREQSFEIQKQLVDANAQLVASHKELTSTVVEMAKSAENREKQIQALIVACKELLASDINESYQRYIALGYIPEDELDEFSNRYRAYRGCNGNHTIETKYKYAMEHLPVVPVESRPILKHKD